MGEKGEEKIIGKGEMMLMEGGGRIKRVNGKFVGEEEVERIVKNIKIKGVKEYIDEIKEDEEDEEGGRGKDGKGNMED